MFFPGWWNEQTRSPRLTMDNELKSHVMPEVHDDLSASTARFRAFTERKDDDLPSPWKMRVSGRKFGLLAAIVIVFALVVALIAYAVAG